MKKEAVKICSKKDAEGRKCYTYSRWIPSGGYWLQPLNFPCASKAAAIRLAMEDGYSIDRSSVLEF
jgi:hypothetical protein